MTVKWNICPLKLRHTGLTSPQPAMVPTHTPLHFFWHHSPWSNCHDTKATEHLTINFDSWCADNSLLQTSLQWPALCSITKCMLVVIVLQWTVSYILPLPPAVRGAFTGSLRWHRRCCLLYCHTQPRHRCVNWRQNASFTEMTSFGR